MANLSEIKKDSNWGEAASTINSNFQNMNVDLEKVKSSTTKFKGYFTTETALKEAYPSPKVGETAWVGSTYPGTVYDVQVAGTWHNTGTAPDTEVVDLTEYARKEELTELESASGYTVCTTESATAAKTIFREGFVLSTGCRLVIKMSNINTAASPTLNINNTGAKPLYYNGEVASADNTWEEGEVLDVYYDGTNYQASNVQGGAGSGGNQILEWDTDAATTRLQVKQNERKPGIIISYYNPSAGWINEQYSNNVNVEDENWSKDANWDRILTKNFFNEVLTASKTNGALINATTG